MLLALAAGLALGVALALSSADSAASIVTRANPFVADLREGGAHVSVPQGTAIDVTAAATATPGAGKPSPVARVVLPVRPSKPRAQHVSSAGGRLVTGQASWWATFGTWAYAAMRPDLHVRNGTLVRVCAGSRCYPRLVEIITSCACEGPGSGRIIDLSAGVFAYFAPLTRGVLGVQVSW